MAEQHPDVERAAGYVHELTRPGGLLARAWTASPSTLTAKQPQADDGSGHGGKPGSRPPTRLDLWSHVQTTLDDARQLCADELGVYLATDRAEEALKRIPGLLEATLDDCNTCLRCQHGHRNGLCAANCADDNGEILRHVCECRHRLIARRLGQLHSTLRTALGDQQPKHDLVDGACPQCGGAKVSVRGDRVWCRSDGCDFVRSGGDFGIGVLSVTG